MIDLSNESSCEDGETKQGNSSSWTSNNGRGEENEEGVSRGRYPNSGENQEEASGDTEGRCKRVVNDGDVPTEECETRDLKRQKTQPATTNIEEEGINNNTTKHDDDDDDTHSYKDLLRKINIKSIKDEPDCVVASQLKEAAFAEYVNNAVKNAVKEALEQEDVQRRERSKIDETNVESAKKMIYTVAARNKALQEELAREKKKNSEWACRMNNLQTSFSASQEENRKLQERVKNCEERATLAPFLQGPDETLRGLSPEDIKQQELTLHIDGLERSLQQTQHDKCELQQELLRRQIISTSTSSMLERKVRTLEQTIQSKDHDLQQARRTIDSLQGERGTLVQSITTHKLAFQRMEATQNRLRGERNALGAALKKERAAGVQQRQKNVELEVYSMSLDDFEKAAANMKFPGE